METPPLPLVCMYSTVCGLYISFNPLLAGAYGRQLVHIKSLVVVVVNSAVKLAYMGVAVVIAELPGCTYG